ncbi:MAG: hypothetical protein N2450_05940 [bacterium]|nr:hypothetical protein [bacterium]
MYVIIVIFALINMLVTFRFWKKWDKSTLINVNAVIGILGTFLGITLALYYFDTSSDNIENQIRLMIESFKLAFITSIIGLFFGMYVRIFKKVDQKIDNEDELQESSIEMLKELLDTQKRIESSFVNVLNDLSNKNVEALEKVVEKFNERVQVQFGDNFKQFSSSLVTFTKNITELSSQMKVLTSELKLERDFYKSFQERLNTATEKAKSAQDRFDRILDRHENVITQLNSSLPQIQNEVTSVLKKVEGITQTMNSTYQDTIQYIKNLLVDVDKNVTSTNQLLNQVQNYTTTFVQNIDGVIKEFQNSTSNLERTLSTVIHQQGEDYQAFLTRTIQDLQNANKNFLNESQDFWGSRVKELREIVQSLQNQNQTYETLLSDTAQKLQGANQDLLQQIYQYIENLNNNLNKIVQDIQNQNHEYNKQLLESINSISDIVAKCAISNDQAKSIETSLDKIEIIIRTICKLLEPFLTLQNKEAIGVIRTMLVNIEELKDEIGKITHPPRRTLLHQLIFGDNYNDHRKK